MINMLEFLIDNIFVSFGGTLFQQVVGIPMGTNCAPLLADLFLYSYESEFLQKLVKDKKIHEARAFNFTHRYIDDVLSINISRFAEFLPLIYLPELEVKETTDTTSSASFVDLHLEFDGIALWNLRDDPYFPYYFCCYFCILFCAVLLFFVFVCLFVLLIIILLSIPEGTVLLLCFLVRYSA